ncbi:MAG: O-antigen ligase family protein [Lachnospiraceae bacterium]|nr:O-antigen ligase family protein [Lachnospiraceae bacterium]
MSYKKGVKPNTNTQKATDTKEKGGNTGTAKTAKAAGKFNPYILPLLFILGILPLIVRLKIVKTNMEGFGFYSIAEKTEDIFLYYKSIFFITTCSIMLVLIIAQAFVRHRELKATKLFIPLAAYAFLAFLSAVFSEYASFSFTGIVDHFESVWVLLGYALCVYYAFLFVSETKDVEILMSVFFLGTVLMLLIGLSQAFSQDIFRSGLGRWLILPKEFYDNPKAQLEFEFPLGRVYLTLFNPNYVGSYVSLISPVFLMLAFAKKKVWLAVVNIIVYIGLLLCILGSGSRAGFIGVAFSLILLVLVFNKKLVKFIPEALIVIVLIVGVVYTFNNYSNGQLLSRAKQAMEIEKTEHNLKAIETNDDNVVIHYLDHELRLSVYIRDDGNVEVEALDENGKATNENGELIYSVALNPDAENTYDFTTTDERFSNISFQFTLFQGAPVLYVNIDRKNWTFIYDGTTYYYVNLKGRAVKMNNAEYVEGLSNYGRAFSGRGFIWSRTLPLLKKYILLGSGPDTFTLTFPNDDYVAMYNGGYENILMTKPHNMYLQIAVQTGVLSLICFLVFYIWYFITSFKLYVRADRTKSIVMVGIGILCGTFGYMIGGIINDSMIVIAPLYWVLIGIGLAINSMIKRDNAFAVLDTIEASEIKEAKTEKNDVAEPAGEIADESGDDAEAKEETREIENVIENPVELKAKVDDDIIVS